MLAWLWPEVCPGCSDEGGLCEACRPGGWHRPRPRSEGIEQVASLVRYTHPLGQALRRAKVEGDKARIDLLAALWARHLPELVRSLEVVALVPAPSTRSALGRRGFSAASILARAASRTLGVPVVDALARSGRGRLAGHGAADRRRLLRGTVRSRRLVAGVVLLVDDVLTTGATAEAAAGELLGGATDRVLLATFAAVDDRPVARVTR